MLWKTFASVKFSVGEHRHAEDGHEGWRTSTIGVSATKIIPFILRAGPVVILTLQSNAFSGFSFANFELNNRVGTLKRLTDLFKRGPFFVVEGELWRFDLNF